MRRSESQGGGKCREADTSASTWSYPYKISQQLKYYFCSKNKIFPRKINSTASLQWKSCQHLQHCLPGNVWHFLKCSRTRHWPPSFCSSFLYSSFINTLIIKSSSFWISGHDCLSWEFKSSPWELKMWIPDSRVRVSGEGLSLHSCGTETLSARTTKVTLSGQVLNPPSLIFPGKDLGKLQDINIPSLSGDS